HRTHPHLNLLLARHNAIENVIIAPPLFQHLLAPSRHACVSVAVDTVDETDIFWRAKPTKLRVQKILVAHLWIVIHLLGAEGASAENGVLLLCILHLSCLVNTHRSEWLEVKVNKLTTLSSQCSIHQLIPRISVYVHQTQAQVRKGRRILH